MDPGRRGAVALSLADLTPVELETLKAAEQGETTPAESARLGISHWTIKSRRDNVRRKLGARTMAQAVAIAAKERTDVGDTPQNAKQISCFKVRAENADKALRRPAGKTEQLALEAASQEFAREICSVKGLSYGETSFVIDRVTDDLRSAT